MSGKTQLSDQKDVERRIERLGHLESDRHTAARQRQHDYVVSAGILPQLRRQLDARFTTI
jgi:hypothetical protein